MQAPESVEPLRRNGCAPTGWRGSRPGRLAGGPTVSPGARVWVGGRGGTPAWPTGGGTPGSPGRPGGGWRVGGVARGGWTPGGVLSGPNFQQRPRHGQLLPPGPHPAACRLPPPSRATGPLGAKRAPASCVCVGGARGGPVSSARGSYPPPRQPHPRVQLEKETSIQGRRCVGDSVYCGPGPAGPGTALCLPCLRPLY